MHQYLISYLVCLCCPPSILTHDYQPCISRTVSVAQGQSARPVLWMSRVQFSAQARISVLFSRACSALCSGFVIFNVNYGLCAMRNSFFSLFRGVTTLNIGNLVPKINIIVWFSLKIIEGGK